MFSPFKTPTPDSRLRKTFGRLHTISQDCKCDMLAAIELGRLEQQLGVTLDCDGCLKCTEQQQWIYMSIRNSLHCTLHCTVHSLPSDPNSLGSWTPWTWTVPKDPKCHVNLLLQQAIVTSDQWQMMNECNRVTAGLNSSEFTWKRKRKHILANMNTT